MLCEQNGTAAIFHRSATTREIAGCVDCEENGLVLRTSGLYLLSGTCVIVILLVLRILKACMPVRIQMAFNRLWMASRPPIKLKLVLGFYQIATKVDEVYEVNMPAAVRVVMEVFKIGVSFGLGSTADVLTCLGLGGFLRRMLFWMAMPITIALIIFISCLARLVLTCRLSSTALLESSLPHILKLLFIFYPIVTNTAFEAFSCYTFDANTNSTRAFLVSDVDIECTYGWGGSKTYHERHSIVTAVAYAAVGLYPIGLLVLYSILLFCCRKAIQSGKHTALSRATSFLHREYEPAFYYWELLEMVRRVFLVGIMVLIERGTVTQLVIGTTFSLVFLLIQVLVQPKNASSLVSACSACSHDPHVHLLPCCPICAGCGRSPAKHRSKRGRTGTQRTTFWQPLRRSRSP